jgi:hypothetical protein
MRTDNGRIEDFLTPEQAEKEQKALEKYQREMAQAEPVFAQMPERVPITGEQAVFLSTKGEAFRTTWARKMARGLTESEKGQLAALIAQSRGANHV